MANESTTFGWQDYWKFCERTTIDQTSEWPDIAEWLPGLTARQQLAVIAGAPAEFMDMVSDKLAPDVHAELWNQRRQQEIQNRR